MFGFVVHRLLAAVPVLAIVALIVFMILRLSPGDPAAILAGDVATPEEIAKIREHLGLDRPLAQQFVTWVGQLVVGDFGKSILSQTPVLHMVIDRMEPTIALSLTTMTFAVIVAIPLGLLAAWKHGTWIDRCVMGVSVVGFSVPVFVVGYLWIFGVSMHLKLLPVQGYIPIGEDFGGFIERLVLPTLTLSLVYIALIARITRASVLEVLQEDYIRTARAKGVPERRLLLRHALRNAGVPIVTVIGIGVALLISGVVITESVFNLPGLGRLTVDAILSRDYPVIQALILVFSFVYVAINLVIDIAYTALDPRIRY